MLRMKKRFGVLPVGKRLFESKSWDFVAEILGEGEFRKLHLALHRYGACFGAIWGVHLLAKYWYVSHNSEGAAPPGWCSRPAGSLSSCW